ncbi:MAG: nucleotidyl transferase AbiEii/AbiGii toxin family protein, partial [Bacteroidetes bacterium]|nr:nucleotidyl transferase AbiEii/AbiGii toxin family protein [Bacteroidota bacterium]
MITQREIRVKAREWKVPPDTVDKDYVLGHFLSVFSQEYKDQLIFKGGTCLRKCYIDNYRFSEDLDFSSIRNSFVIDTIQIDRICQKISRDIGIRTRPQLVGDD